MPTSGLVLQNLCRRHRPIGIRHSYSSPNSAQDISIGCPIAKAVWLHNRKHAPFFRYYKEFIIPYSTAVHYAPRWHSVRSNFKIKVCPVTSLTVNHLQRYFIVIVRSQNGTPSVLHLRGERIGRSPHLEYHYLGCPPTLLHVPRTLRLLGCPFNVISFISFRCLLTPG